MRDFSTVIAVLAFVATALAQEATPEEVPPGAAAENEWTETVDVSQGERETVAPEPVSSEPMPLEAMDSPLPSDLLEPPPIQGVAMPVVTDNPIPSHNVTVNLINRLVERGVLTKEDAAELIAQAQTDAEIARSRDMEAAQAIASTNAAAQELIAKTPPPPGDDSVRVTYIPSVVRAQIRDEIKEDVMTRARDEGWAAPKLVPWWVQNIRPFADFRFRYEGIYFPSGNDDSGVFPNFNAINNGAPFDVTGDEFSPQLNVNENRNRLRIRVRLGAEVNLGEGFTAGARLATGDSNSPTSTNQSLGTPNGNFNKYQIWLDRAFLQYEIKQDPNRALGLIVGRFDNPFFRVSQIQWDDDLGFDGVALHGKYEVGWGLKPFFAGGVFPVYNSAFNFASNQPSKYQSNDKWLYGIQGGLDWDVTSRVNLTTALGYFYFQNIEGKLSTPYVPMSSSDAGDTDESRPLFAQKGNTYRPIRDIIPTEANDFGTINQWQYYGLATKFQNLSFAGQLTVSVFEPYVIALGGEYTKNLAFNDGDINAVAVNNRGNIDPDDLDAVGDFVGGDSAWIVQIEAGHPLLEKRWDWNVEFGYRWVESDAVVDGFNDSDFGGGGTNLKGWTGSVSLALSSNVWLTARYLSGRSIAGPQFKEDIVQLDINARF